MKFDREPRKPYEPWLIGLSGRSRWYDLILRDLSPSSRGFFAGSLIGAAGALLSEPLAAGVLTIAGATIGGAIGIRRESNAGKNV